MFWNNFLILCARKGVSPSRACADLGLSNATATKWKNGATPRQHTLKKIADYFNVSTDLLLTNVHFDIQNIAVPSPDIKDMEIVTVTTTLGNTVPTSTEAFAAAAENYRKAAAKMGKRKGPTTTVSPKLFALIDGMTADEAAELERYAEFILSKKKVK